MTVGIHYNGKDAWPNFSLKRFRDILDKNNIDYKLLYAGKQKFWNEVAKCDLFLFRWGHNDTERQIASSIINIVEKEMGIKCYPNSYSSWIYDNKIRQYYMLKVNGFPVVETHIFYDLKRAQDFIEQAAYPLVFKLTSGAGSRTVKLLKDKNTAKKYTKLMFGKGIPYKKGLPGELYDKIKNDKLIPTIRKKIGKYKRRIFYNIKDIHDQDWEIHKNYILIQKFLPKNDYDTRVVVIGRRAAAFQRLNRENDFRASGSKNYSLEPGKIDLGFVKIAFEISKKFGFDSMAYDFIYDENKEPAVVELSYTFGSSTKGSNISKCSGYWDDTMTWHEAPLDVEYEILSCLLTNIDLNR